MRNLGTALLILCAASLTLSANDPSLFVRKLRTVNNGTRTANIVSFDREGAMTRFTKDDIRIQEGGLPAEIISVTCPTDTERVDVSSVLTLDISGSMKRGAPNLLLAKEAAKAWISALSEESECAITTFSTESSLLVDFTRDKQRLTNSLEALAPYGGTNFKEALLGDDNGGMSVVRRGSNRKVIVFLTDGSGRVSSRDVIRAAREANAVIYCVSVSGCRCRASFSRLLSRPAGSGSRMSPR